MRSEPNGKIPRIKRAPIQLPPEVALGFVEDMRAYLIEPNAIKRDE